FPTPAEFARQPSNGGIEALTALADSRLVAISEEWSLRPGTVVGWIALPTSVGAYTWTTFEYATTPDFAPTAIVQLPDGSIATIQRAFDYVRGVRCRVMRFAAADLKPGGTVRAQETGLPCGALCGRQSGRPGGDQGAARRDLAVADLGRQLQSAS